jgi:hypothetical protein
MIFGLIKGLVINISLLAVCSIIAEVPVFGTSIHNEIAKTKVGNFVYKYVDQFVEEQLTAEKVEEIVDKIVSQTDEDKKETTDTNNEQTNTDSDSNENTETK